MIINARFFTLFLGTFRTKNRGHMEISDDKEYGDKTLYL
ncbi:hypothetical protein PEC311524_20050 [Pectobacterium carotovorum subsp. carotovorum]|nr:hypothetical protein PEC311524_20050 [Pectobacterium carotovorum subsp. carotovorum]